MDELEKNLLKNKEVNVKNKEEDEKISNWINTYCIPLNVLLSGDIYKGLPEGKITSLVGHSQSGKSFYARYISKMLQKHKDYTIIWFDEENAIEDSSELEDFGIDLNKFIIPQSEENRTVESFTKDLKNILDEIGKIKKKNPNKKYLIVLDSMGQLYTKKQLGNVNDKDSGQDMGQRAKIIKEKFGSLSTYLFKYNIPMLLINHVYDDPSDMFATMPEVSGGNYLKFISHRIIMMFSKNVKNKDKTIQRKFKHTDIKMLAYKNRKIIRGSYIMSRLDYRKGLHPFYDICSTLPRIYESTSNKKEKFIFHEYKLYNKDEQEKKISKLLNIDENNIQLFEKYDFNRKILDLKDNYSIFYFKLNDKVNKTDIDKIKKLKLIKKPKNKTEANKLKLDDFKYDREVSDKLNKNDVVVRFQGVKLDKMKDIYKNMGKNHFTKDLLKRLNEYVNDVFLYQNEEPQLNVFKEEKEGKKEKEENKNKNNKKNSKTNNK